MYDWTTQRFIKCFFQGNLDSILAAYDEQKRTVAEGQDAERARQQAQLQEKLQQRRSRATRLEAQQL